MLHKVLGVYPQGYKDVYRITFNDRTFIDCCEEHLWTIQLRSQRNRKKGEDKENYFPLTLSLKEILEKYPIKTPTCSGHHSAANIYIPLTKPVNYPTQQHLIHPYLLGCLLGDGCLSNSKRSIGFTNADKDILERVSQLLSSLKLKLSHRTKYDYDIVNDDNDYRYHFMQFKNELSRLKLLYTHSDTKFIPSEYQYDSIENRIELIKGIIDTDGYCEGGAYDICLKSKQLIDDIKAVIESLGMTATYSEKNAWCSNSPEGHKNCGTVYSLHIKPSYYIQKIHSSERREKQ